MKSKAIEQLKNMSEFPIAKDLHDTDKLYINRDGNLYQIDYKKVIDMNRIIHSNEIPYTNKIYPDMKTVQDALDVLLHKKLEVVFNYSADIIQQKGNILNDFVIGWQYSLDSLKSQSINDMNLYIENREYIDKGSIKDNRTYNFKYSDIIESYSKTIELKFVDAIFIGSSTKSETSTNILSDLDKILSETNNIDKNITISGTEKLYYACPISYPDPVILVNNSGATITKVIPSLAYSNDAYSALYKVFKIDASNGTFIIDIK